jgi:hypothetical protein
LRFIQFGQGIEPASELKGAHALEVLTFHVDLSVHSIVQRTGTKNWRLVCHAFKPSRRRQNIIKGG